LASPNLSDTESQYLTHRCTLLSHHFSASFLSSFPAQLQKLDDTAGGISMVDGPDVDAAVFCRVLRDAGHVEVQGEQGVGEVELRRGDVWCVRWSAVKDAVLRGDVEMI
jgi:GINS complex subunit 4